MPTSSMISHKTLSVSTKRVPVDLEALRLEPCMSGGVPVAEVDVTIHDKEPYTHNPNRVWWQMLLRLLPGRTAFIYEPTLGARGYLDRWGASWVRDHLEIWPDLERPLEVVRVDERFLELARAQTEESWLRMMNAIVHAISSSVLIHEGPPGQPITALRPLELTIATEHEWNGGRFFFYRNDSSPEDVVARLFEGAVLAAPLRSVEHVGSVDKP